MPSLNKSTLRDAAREKKMRRKCAGFSFRLARHAEGWALPKRPRVVALSCANGRSRSGALLARLVGAGCTSPFLWSSAKAQPLEFHPFPTVTYGARRLPHPPEPMYQRGRRGPAASASAAGLAFDDAGHRLGYGGGFYAAPSPTQGNWPSVIAYAGQEVPSLPHEQTA